MLLLATQCTVTMPVMMGCISVGQNSCGWDQMRVSDSFLEYTHVLVTHLPLPLPQLLQPPILCSSTLLTFSWVSDGHRETSTRAPCSHTSSQSSSGPAGPVSTTWSQPEGPPCRAQPVGSYGLSRPLPVPQLQETPKPTPRLGSTNGQRGQAIGQQDQHLTGKSQASGISSAGLSSTRENCT